MRHAAAVLAVAFLVFVAGAAAADTPYVWLAKWDCAAPCTITYTIDPSFPARTAGLIREVYTDISVAPEVEMVESRNGQVGWETCESSRERELANACGFWTYMQTANGRREFATLKHVEVKFDAATWDGLVGLKRYVCHEALHSLGFGHAPRYLPSCFAGDNLIYEPGQEDYELIRLMYGG